jgi:hypothetical protein
MGIFIDECRPARLAVFFAIVTLASILSFSSQASSSGGTRVFDQGVEPWEAESAFDVGAKVLPISFQGNTVAWVVRHGTLAPRRTETNAEYDARRRSFHSETFAFVLDRQPYTYDRLSETATIRIYPAFPGFHNGHASDFAAFNIKRLKRSPTSRAGPARPTSGLTDRDRASRGAQASAFEAGAVTAIKRSRIQTQVIVTESSASFKPSYAPLVFTAKVPLARAKNAKSNLRVVFVCVPAEEQYGPIGDPDVPEATGRDSGRGGVSDFSDEEITYYIGLRAALIQVWLFDQSTGEVYGRYTPSSEPVPE